MNKKIMLGALALSATAVFGLTGCGDKKDKEPETPKYTVTFDHDNNSATENMVVEFEEGTEVLDPSVIPAVPEVDGFAGVWDSFTLNDQNITVTAQYGDGSQNNPYMVSTSAQFKKIIDDYTQYVSTTYAKPNGTSGEESESTTKYVNYKTVTVRYTRPDVSSDWELSGYETENKTYFKLINDIDLSIIEGLSVLNLSGRYFSGEIDGQGYSIKGLDGSLFVSTEGAMIESIVSTTIKNLNVHLGDNLGTLVAYAMDGENSFESINIYNLNSKPTFVSAYDNNESPFIFHAFGDSTQLRFVDCTNKANMIISADYCGLFLGGYAKNIAKLSFENCVNDATIKSAGSVGMLTGNGSYSPVVLNVDEDCKNLGDVATKKTSHILVSYKTGSGLISTKVADYDTLDRLKGANGEVKGSLNALTTDYVATVSDNDITVEHSEEDMDIATGKYELILSTYVSNASGEGHMSLLTNIVINADVTKSESYTFQSAYFGMMDLNTYNTIYSRNITPNDDNVTWIEMEGYNIRYFVDGTNGYYVIDFSGYEQNQGIANNKFVLNKSKEDLNKVIIVHNVDNNDIEFIADFN